MYDTYLANANFIPLAVLIAIYSISFVLFKPQFADY